MDRSRQDSNASSIAAPEVKAQKAREDALRRKIILPADIPWECGSNRFASQKGMSAFGCKRDNVVRVSASKDLSNSSDGVIPKLQNHDDFKPPSQSGQTPFGGSRVFSMYTKPQDGDEDNNANILDPESTTFLSLWAQGNANASNGDIGKRRGAKTDAVGKVTIRKRGDKVDHRSNGILPRLQDHKLMPSVTGTGAGIAGFSRPRQITMGVEYDFTRDEREASDKVVPWLCGPQVMQTQSKTGGFNKSRDVCNQTYYDEKRPMNSYRFL